MQDIYERSHLAAKSKCPVLILGPTGTGKEKLAQHIHAISKRKGKFVPINCGAIPENLLETELFGHVKGAYTDAKGAREGAFQHARGGTSSRC